MFELFSIKYVVFIFVSVLNILYLLEVICVSGF